MTKIAVHGDEDIEMAGGATKQLAVLDAAPALSEDGVYLVWNQMIGKTDGNILIK